MFTARLVTVGTEITNGEVVNSNAAWVSHKLENLGIRVISHFSVRDRFDEILQALRFYQDCQFLVVTGGLGPTSDDITREVVAKYIAEPLEFDFSVWRQLEELYKKRGLTLRAAHKRQCYFPRGSERLANSVGTALGFRCQKGKQEIFVLPGPPRELEGMWNEEVERRLALAFTPEKRYWHRWTCIGVPESEVAELVEPLINGRSIEFGYRAQVPYVRVKAYVDRNSDQELIKNITEKLTPYLAPEDVATELVKLWRGESLIVSDQVCGTILFERLSSAKAELGSRLSIEFHSCGFETQANLLVKSVSEDVQILLCEPSGRQHSFTKRLPFKIPLCSERGRKSIAEWSMFLCLKAITN